MFTLAVLSCRHPQEIKTDRILPSFPSSVFDGLQLPLLFLSYIVFLISSCVKKDTFCQQQFVATGVRFRSLCCHRSLHRSLLYLNNETMYTSSDFSEESHKERRCIRKYCLFFFSLDCDFVKFYVQLRSICNYSFITN